MFLDGAQLVVDYECERILPGWIPRRLGEWVWSVVTRVSGQYCITQEVG